MHSNDTIEKIGLNELMNNQAVEMIERYDIDTQTLIVVEELSELITALSHYSRGKISREDVISELADVEMMITQLKYMVCETAEEYTDVLRNKLAKQRGYYEQVRKQENSN